MKPIPRAAAVALGIMARWTDGCSCTRCRQAQNAAAKARFRRKAQDRLPAMYGQQLPDAIYSGQPFRTVLRDLGLTSNQVWGLTKTDDEWAAALETALIATRRDDLRHGTNAAYLHGCGLQGVSGASAAADGQESELIKINGELRSDWLDERAAGLAARTRAVRSPQ